MVVDIDSLRKRHKNSIRNTPTGRALGEALNEVERLTREVFDMGAKNDAWALREQELTRERDEARDAARWLHIKLAIESTRGIECAAEQRWSWLVEAD